MFYPTDSAALPLGASFPQPCRCRLTYAVLLRGALLGPLGRSCFASWTTRLPRLRETCGGVLGLPDADQKSFACPGAEHFVEASCKSLDWASQAQTTPIVLRDG